MDATCTIQDSIHVFNLVHKYVSRILGTYQSHRTATGAFVLYYNCFGLLHHILQDFQILHGIACLQ